MMDDQRQSDRPGVPTKAPNNPAHAGAEGLEGSGLAEGNLRQQNAPRTQRRVRCVTCAGACASGVPRARMRGLAVTTASRVIRPSLSVGASRVNT